MPKYRYKCESCEFIFFAHHSISKLLKDCEYCNTNDSLTKLPTSFRLIEDVVRETSTGQIVKRSIEEFREDLKEEKRRLKDRKEDIK